MHELWVEQFQQEPGERAAWVAHKALNRAVQEGRLIDVPPIIPGQMPDECELAVEQFGDNLTAGINGLPVLPDHDQGLENRFGLLCDWVLIRLENGTRGQYTNA